MNLNAVPLAAFSTPAVSRAFLADLDRVLGVAVPAGNRGCSREKVQGLTLASARDARSGEQLSAVQVAAANAGLRALQAGGRTPSKTPSLTGTPSNTPTGTPSNTPTGTPSKTPTRSPSTTPSLSESPTPSSTTSTSRTPTPSSTPASLAIVVTFTVAVDTDADGAALAARLGASLVAPAGSLALTAAALTQALGEQSTVDGSALTFTEATWDVPAVDTGAAAGDAAAWGSTSTLTGVCVCVCVWWR